MKGCWQVFEFTPLPKESRWNQQEHDGVPLQARSAKDESEWAETIITNDRIR